MSNKVKKGEYVELWYSDLKMVGTFQMLNCEVHGDELCFTDTSGADNCVECIKDMLELKPEHKLPFHDETMAGLEKLSVN